MDILQEFVVSRNDSEYYMEYWHVEWYTYSSPCCPGLPMIKRAFHYGFPNLNATPELQEKRKLKVLKELQIKRKRLWRLGDNNFTEGLKKWKYVHDHCL